ncbi:phage protein [Streptococcus pyogenes]|nr:phage protein [Streptococcus pyogenes]
MEEFKKSEYVEIAMGEAVQKVDDLEKLSQETAKTAKTAQTAAGLAKVSAERTRKMINLQTIHVLTSGSKVEPDIYKGLLELIEPAKKGEYQAYDVFTVVDESHEEQAGEGNLVFVHVNEPFTYDKQTLKELEEEDKVTVIKYADLVKQD